jgi:surface antigen
MATLSACSTTHGSGGGNSTLGLLSPTKASPSAPFIKALDGGIIGRTGVKLSDSDQQRALEAEYRALEAAPGGQPVAWTGRGVSGQVVAAAPYQVGSQNCRQYTHTVTVGSNQTQARGAACRNDDGTWSLLN